MAARWHTNKFIFTFHCNYKWSDFKTFWDALVVTADTMINTDYGGTSGPDGLDIREIVTRRHSKVYGREAKGRTGMWEMLMKYEIRYHRGGDRTDALNRLNRDIKGEYRGALLADSRFAQPIKAYWDESTGGQEQ